MRWSALHTAGFLAFGLAVLGLLNIAGRTAIHGPTPPQTMRIAYDDIAGKDAVSLGGSIGTAVDFEAMGVDGARFFNNGQDPFETEALVALILSRPEPPRLFLLVTSAQALHHDNALPALAGSYRRRFTYRFLHSAGDWGLIGNDWRQAFLSEAMPAIGNELRVPWHQAALHALIDIPPADPAIIADTRFIAPDAAMGLAQVQASAWQDAQKRVQYVAPETPERVAASLLRTVSLISASGNRAIVVVPPYIRELEHLLRNEDRATEDRFGRLLDDLELRGATVLDMRFSPAADYGHFLFRDASHLNAHGAKSISREIAERLRRDGVLSPPRAEKPRP